MVCNSYVLNRIENGSEKADDHLEEENKDDLLPSVLLELGFLRSCFKGVLHDLGVVASVSDKSVDEASISQRGAPQDKVAVRNGDLGGLEGDYILF